MFVYLASEQAHLETLCLGIWLQPQCWQDAGYWRHQAAMTPKFDRDEFLEMAEAIECGMQHGESL